MNAGGFGRESGPGGRASGGTQKPTIGNFPQPRFPIPPLNRSPRALEALERPHPSPLAFVSSHYVTRPFRPPIGVPSQSPPIWDSGKNFPNEGYFAESHQRPSAVMPLVASSNSTTSTPAKASEAQALRRTRSPSLSSDEENLRNSSGVRGSRAGLLSKSQSNMVTQQKQSPPMAFQGNSFLDGTHPPPGEAKLSASYFPVWGNQSKPPGNFTGPSTQPVMPSVHSNLVMHDSRRKSPTEQVDIQALKRSRSPTFQSGSDVLSADPNLALFDHQRSSSSPPKPRSNGHSGPPVSQSRQQSPTSVRHNEAEIANKQMNFPVAKKTKLPSLSSSDQVFKENFISAQDEANRELEAKAKRLVRFKNELDQPMQNDPSIKNQKVPAKRQQAFMTQRQKLIAEPTVDMTGDFSNVSVLSEHEGMDSSSIIIGLCLDMCPELERAERERKGDLDHYERLDGDRNQTSKALTVKKYNRTAEREAELIRPMAILQKTIDYLLNLLNQPYDDSFLRLYNFLWDRMRAIRMDLRMQHIFSVGAIKMLEQMIRLHIIAMHELCEYTKGEGFSEGFDAHLNIEQMNKTSVELFQLYDDHRKRGTNVVTEKEFRGYYALLKLDKHPGYKVEPAELSLDLAKMTPDMRQSSEVVFARDVARACRTGNFIAFFRLAQKASYLQACLMHAHFAKLRTHALAALHSGLQNNIGIPVEHVAKWLGMEEEDIEDLLEYHGFSLKEFEVPYMVKEGPFLNVDNDYPVRCSKLVHRKKSMTIVEDVSYPHLAKSSPPKEATERQLNDGIEQKPSAVRSLENKVTIQVIDEEMPEYISSPKDGMQVMPRHMMAVNQIGVSEVLLSPASPLVQDSSLFCGSPKFQQARIGSTEKSKYDTLFRNSLDRDVQVDLKETLSSIISGQGKDSFTVPQFDFVVPSSEPQHSLTEELVEEHTNVIEEVEADEATTCYDGEVAEAKLKLILRVWKRCSLKKKELREQKRLAANVALTSLSLGLPIWRPETQASTSGDFNIDQVMSKRFAILEKSRSRLNISELVAATLTAKNPDAKCLCWKILLCGEENSSYNDHLGKKKEIADMTASSWLLRKLVPINGDDDYNGDLSFSSPGLSIWKKWFPSQSGGGQTCCLTIVREAKSENLNEVVVGASAVLFVVSECVPWEVQRNRLHKILMALPSGSHLPLLIFGDPCKSYFDPSAIIKELGLHDIDRSRISTFCVSFLKSRQMEQLNVFFSDEQLREGLLWLANESPPQPVLSWIKTRDLVLFHLNSSLAFLNDMDAHEVGPNNCISAFNEALDQSLEKVAAAGYANPTSWPCPEIALLEESSDECRAVSWYLPSKGWSLDARLEPLICALTDSKLPLFEDDLSWLYRGADGCNDIEKQILKLEDCLINYFTEMSHMMVLPLATKEASLILQKFARLELHNSTYHITPHWVMIFQRVFHWRLMDLSNGAASSAYILAHDDISMSTSVVLDMSSPSYMAQPSLNEMVEIGRILPTFGVLHLDHGASQPCSRGNDIEKTIAEGNKEDGGNVEQSGVLVSKNDCIAIGPSNGSKFALASEGTKEADKLSALLEKCNIVQNMIQERLSIYF